MPFAARYATLRDAFCNARSLRSDLPVLRLGLSSGPSACLQTSRLLRSGLPTESHMNGAVRSFAALRLFVTLAS